MLVQSAKDTRIVPPFATNKKSTYTKYIESCFIENADLIPTTKKDKLEADVRFVKIQGRNRILRYRPILKNWKMEFKLVDVPGRLPKSDLKEMLEYGGMFIGIGDARKLRFGRFEIEDVKEVAK